MFLGESFCQLPSLSLTPWFQFPHVLSDIGADPVFSDLYLGTM